MKKNIVSPFARWASYTVDDYSVVSPMFPPFQLFQHRIQLFQRYRRAAANGWRSRIDTITSASIISCKSWLPIWLLYLKDPFKGIFSNFQYQKKLLIFSVWYKIFSLIGKTTGSDNLLYFIYCRLRSFSISFSSCIDIFTGAPWNTKQVVIKFRHRIVKKKKEGNLQYVLIHSNIIL